MGELYMLMLSISVKLSVLLNELGWVIINTGDEASDSKDANLNMDCSAGVRVITLHISSPILAAKSPFFYKVDISYSLVRFEYRKNLCLLRIVYILQLFSNGMRESEQRHVTLRISASGTYIHI